jgi:hypothetical protein
MIPNESEPNTARSSGSELSEDTLRNQEIIDPKRVRSSLRTLQRAVERGWEIPQNIVDAAPLIVASILTDKNAAMSARLRAAEVLAAMARDRVNAAISLDKIQRLDSGTATERFEISPDIRARVQEIVAKRLGHESE